MYTFQLQLEPHIQQPQYEQDTISTGASYLHVSSRASIYKPLGRLRPHSDKTPGGIFRGFEHGQSTRDQVHKYCIYTLHGQSSRLTVLLAPSSLTHTCAKQLSLQRHA